MHDSPTLAAKELSAVRDVTALLNAITNTYSPVTRVHIAQTIIKVLQDAFPTKATVDPYDDRYGGGR